jgi:hypothetical protein
LRQATVFAAVTRPLPYELARCGVDHEAAFLSNRVRACACNLVIK